MAQLHLRRVLHIDAKGFAGRPEPGHRADRTGKVDDVVQLVDRGVEDHPAAEVASGAVACDVVVRWPPRGKVPAEVRADADDPPDCGEVLAKHAIPVRESQVT